MSIYENEIFWCQGIFFINFDFKNICKNKFKDNKEKLCSWSRNRVSHKIDFNAILPLNGHADSVGVHKFIIIIILSPCLGAILWVIRKSFGVIATALIPFRTARSRALGDTLFLEVKSAVLSKIQKLLIEIGLIIGPNSDPCLGL